MKAVVVSTPGGPEVLEVVERPKPVLKAGWTLADFDPIVELAKNVYLTTFYSGNVSNDKLQELIDFVELYQVDVRPEKFYRLEEIQEAHTYLESSQSFGKVIVKIEEEYD